MSDKSARMSKKPVNIIYGLDESPSVLVTIMAGLQQVGVVSINLVYPPGG
jgi:xanthine permease XanP